MRVKTAEEARFAIGEFKHQPCVLEKMMPLVCEISAIVTRTASGEIACFPVAENHHADGYPDVSIVPARVTPEITERAQTMAQQLAAALNYVGVMAVEILCWKATNSSSTKSPRARTIQATTHWMPHSPTSSNSKCVPYSLTPGKTDLLSPVTMINLLGGSWGQDGSEPNWVL